MSARPSPLGGIAALPRLATAAELSGRIADGVRQLLEEAILAGVLDAGSHIDAGALATQVGLD